MNETIQVVCVGDAAYGQHVGVMLCSLWENTAQPQRVQVTLLDGGLLEKDKSKLCRLAQRYEATLYFECMDRTRFVHLRVDGQVSQATYYRLLIPEVLPDTVHRALYLDGDMVVLDDVGLLWATHLDGRPIGAAVNPGFTRRAELGMPEWAHYVNAGVLLMDLDVWRREGIGKRVAEFVSANADRCLAWDQDGINALLWSRCQRIHARWNQQTITAHSTGALPELWKGERRDALENPGIVHFEGIRKPWQYLNWDDRSKHYHRYLRMTEWRDYVPPDRTPGNVVRRPYWRVKRAWRRWQEAKAPG